MNSIEKRKDYTLGKVEELKEKLASSKKHLGGDDAGSRVACVYATGSFGRGEASEFSDLDAFIAGYSLKLGDGSSTRALKRLDEICLKADLVSSVRACRLPEFDGDGEYLKHYSVDQLISSLGNPDDDVKNTFTARLLLLLESSPLLGENVYQDIIDEVIATYWRDYDDHKQDFAPSFLVNDILRFWRTLCVGYEARTKSTPDSEKAKRRAKNYKLKHSRVMTCFSTILHLTGLYASNGTIGPKDMRDIVSMTPMERVKKTRILDVPKETPDALDRVEQAYLKFLETSHCSNDDLKKCFSSDAFHNDKRREAGEFGDAMCDAVLTLGQGNWLVRNLIV
jgi:hypothetical protein